jgi:Mrp family chromosome partitioning ATPase
LHSARMREFLNQALEKFGRVVIDSPPLRAVTDAAILATLVEGVLLVVKAEGVPRKAAIQARNDLLGLKAPLLGAVLNNLPMNERGNGSYCSQYYGYHAYHTPEGDKAVGAPQRSQTKPGPCGWVKERLNNLRQRI